MNTLVKSERLVRKQVLLTPYQNAGLKRLAAVSGRSEGDLVREAVETLVASGSILESDWKSAWREAAGMWKDYPELDQLMADRRKRRGLRRDAMNTRMRGETV